MTPGEAFERVSAAWPWGMDAQAERDGFKGSVCGWYVTREGKPGIVIEQHGTIVCHLYRETSVTRSAP